MRVCDNATAKARAPSAVSYKYVQQDRVRRRRSLSNLSVIGRTTTAARGAVEEERAGIKTKTGEKNAEKPETTRKNN